MQYKDPYIEICIEGASSVFRGLSQTDKEALDQHHLSVNFRKGETIISEGTKPKGLICLVSGKAKLFTVGAGNREQILKMLRPHSYLAYRSLFSDISFPFDVSAVEDSAVVILDKHTISRILKQNSELAIRFIKIVSEDLLSADKRLISLTQKHVRGRLAESILLLTETYGLEADGKTLRVLLSREDLAHLSSMTTSNAIRTLSVLASENILATKGRKIVILDFSKLDAISKSGQ
jgi:CRP-like cAMP-binding protein